MRRSTEAKRLLEALDQELAEASAEKGEPLVWSAAETQTLKAIADAVDRKGSLSRDYDKATTPSLRVSLSAELRYLEKQITALLKDIRTDLPQAKSTPAAGTSTASRNAAKAANARWKPHRMASGQA